MHKMLVLSLVSMLCFSSRVAASIGEAAKPFLLEGVKASCDVVLRGRRGASSHSHVESHVVWQAQYLVLLELLLCGADACFCMAHATP